MENIFKFRQLYFEENTAINNFEENTLTILDRLSARENQHIGIFM